MKPLFNFSTCRALALTCACASALYAPLGLAELPAITLTIKPKVCVLSNEDEACNDELQITWQAQQDMNLCLYQKHQDTPLACWQNEREGSHTMALSTSTSLAFMLREMQQNQLLASETFEVVHDHKQFRRARRNAWAFF